MKRLSMDRELFNKKMVKKLLFLILLACITGACEQQSEYEQLVEREMKKEIRKDSLFLGYKFGMSKKDFFQYSWKLNQEGVVKGNAQVVYEFDDLASTAQMVFYPDFHDNRIYRMPAEISYKSWAPWNPELSADSLLVDLIDFYRQKYGDGFIKTKLPNIEGTPWVKVDGNRRIAVYTEDNRKVRVEFLDLETQQMLDEKQDK